jgi:diguanylate cyclase (GGDEF)-like protein
MGGRRPRADVRPQLIERSPAPGPRRTPPGPRPSEIANAIPSGGEGTDLAMTSIDVVWLANIVLALIAAASLVVAIVADRRARRQPAADAQHSAHHDALTGLPNRMLLGEHLNETLARARHSGIAIAVLFLDIDRFSMVNESRGHSVGDELLCIVASRLRQTIRPTDVVARFGGDEFVIVTDGGSPGYSPASLSYRLLAALSEPAAIGDTNVTMTVSVGAAVARPGDDPESLLRDAAAAMHRAKDQGRNRCVVSDSAMRAGATDRLERERSLRRALAGDELLVYYQPVVALASGRIVGVEALVRWLDSTTGRLVPPIEFIAIAEETGLIVPLGARVLKQACADIAALLVRDPLLAPMSVAVNLSARQLLAPGLPDTIEDALTSSGLPASSLCLEITESVLVEDTDLSGTALRALRALGVHIAMDDFGTGYSSLSYLKRLPIDTLKIDKSFVDGLGGEDEHRADRAVVASVIDLAHAFGLTTVAEGVETDEQLAALHALGCENVQGYLISRPLPLDRLVAWIPASPTSMAGGAMGIPRVSPDGRKRMLVVEDDRSLRAMLRLVVEDADGVEVVGEAGDGREAVALARHLQPDVVLLDLAMPGMGGLEALPLILAVAPHAKVVVLSGLEPADVAEVARARGAFGYLQKGDDPRIFVDRLDRMLAPAA